MSFNTYLNRFNQAQRVIAGIVFSMIVISIFMHNPMSGYITISYDSFEKQLPPCSDEDKRKYRAFLTDFHQSNADTRIAVSKEIDEKVARCHIAGSNTPIDSTYDIEIQTTPLPFALWKSNAPLIEWFGLALHFIYSIVATIILGAFFIFVVFPRSISSSDK